jgi:DNA end-binding protein Ku
MPARAIASGTISFGLVAIPIKLYSASQASERLSFNLLHGKCHSRLRQQYICPKDNEIVDRDQMVKGYEFTKGQYVVFTEEELKALEEKRSESIEITEFIPASTVDPVFFDKTYYLGPDKGGDRPYALLSQALRESGRVALARYAARGKQYLVLIRAIDGGLVLQQLYYSNEVRAFSEVPIGEAAPKAEELKLARLLIDHAAADEFHPERYEDATRKRILEQIQQKVDGQEISLTSEEEPSAQIIDLMEALKASLARKAETGSLATPPAPARSSGRRSDDAVGKDDEHDDADDKKSRAATRNKKKASK